METVIVVAPQGYEKTLRSRIPDRYRVTDGSRGTTVIEDGAKRIYLWESSRVVDEFAPEERAIATQGIQSPDFYLIDFHDIGFCRDLLLAIADDPAIIVDNNQGTILPGSEFARLLRERPNWDWRRFD